MLLSMTGFGEAHRQQAGLAVTVELRTINSRYFKLVVRCSEGYGQLEPQIEATIREQIKRGTVQVNIRVDRAASPDDFRLNAVVLETYRKQLLALHEAWHLKGEVSAQGLLGLPGVVDDHASGIREVDADWPVLRETLLAAMDHLAKMRSDEGRSMAADLVTNLHVVAAELGHIERRAPQTIDAYRARLEERVKKVLADYEVSLSAADLIREISIFTERSDISEEIVRLRSHLEQFEAIMGHEDSAGRKLEFLTQEMLRETNTIGSKSSDLEIARHVIEIKATIERIREMIQNVE